MKKAKRKPAKPYRVAVTEVDIRTGECGDCFRCAVAIALQRATDDDHANVYTRDWDLMIEVHGRSMLAPQEIASFVYAYDRLPRDAAKKPVGILTDDTQPFVFTLPSLGNKVWKERCYNCEELFPTKKLDDEGYCPECHKENA